MAVASGPFCTALGCTDEADVIARIDGRERHVCHEHANGEVIADV